MELEIIAEAAQGYRGDPDHGCLLADLAAAADADAVKLQLVYADELCTPDYRLHQHFTSVEMPDAAWEQIARRCHDRGIRLYVDVFGPRSLDLATRIRADGVKVHSSDTLNLGLLEAIVNAPVARVIVSVGGSRRDETRRIVEMLGDKDLLLMHGFQGYPTHDEDNQLSRIDWLRSEFPERTVGFADHVPFDDAARHWLAAAAVGAGATVVEKHITTAVALREVDHDAALNPDEFARFVANMRLAARAMGAVELGEDFGMSESEANYRHTLKKQVVAAQDLSTGQLVRAEDVSLKRTSSTDSILHDTSEVVGRRLTEPVLRDAPLRATQLE